MTFSKWALLFFILGATFQLSAQKIVYSDYEKKTAAK